MSGKLVPKLTYRKYRGDDSRSWAVFAVGNPVPIDTGLTRTEARHSKAVLEKMYAERARADVPPFRGDDQ